MKLYTSLGPNPRVVRMFAAEKGVLLDLVEIDIIAGENRQEPYLSINPLGGTPTLVLDNGQVITETIAACEFLDESKPGLSLIGATPESRATTRMWARRIDLGFAEPLTLGFRAAEGRSMFAPRVIVVDEAAANDLKAMAFVTLDFVEHQCADGKQVAGDAVTLPDIILFCFIEFAMIIGMKPLEGRSWLTEWHAKMAARPSSSA
ncbi:MAG: isoJ [Sphingomonadales bacterium]|nr:isoJ [Sphingomonadales bacterium]